MEESVIEQQKALIFKSLPKQFSSFRKKLTVENKNGTKCFLQRFAPLTMLYL